jgi:hypothetical protein
MELETINNLIKAEYQTMCELAIAKNISYNGSIFNSEWTINIDGIDKHKQVEIGIIFSLLYSNFNLVMSEAPLTILYQHFQLMYK